MDRREPRLERDEDAKRDLDARNVPAVLLRHRRDEQRPAVLQVGDQHHADDADDQLRPAVGGRRAAAVAAFSAMVSSNVFQRVVARSCRVAAKRLRSCLPTSRNTDPANAYPALTSRVVPRADRRDETSREVANPSRHSSLLDRARKPILAADRGRVPARAYWFILLSGVTYLVYQIMSIMLSGHLRQAGRHLGRPEWPLLDLRASTDGRGIDLRYASSAPARLAGTSAFSWRAPAST